MKRYATSRDGNEKEIVKALRDAGIRVTRIESTLDPGVPDLLCEVPDRATAAARVALATARSKLDRAGDITTACEAQDLIDAALAALSSGGHRWVLLEIKNPKVLRRKRGMVRAEDVDTGGYPTLVARLGKRMTMHLMYTQADFLSASTAPWAVVETVEEALAACGVSDEKA